MKITILGVDYEIIFQQEKDNPKLKDSAGLCEWADKKLYINLSCKDDPNALDNVDAYLHKVLRHEALHALFAEMGMRKWMDDEELIDMIAMIFDKIESIMSACDNINIP